MEYSQPAKNTEKRLNWKKPEVRILTIALIPHGSKLVLGSNF